MLFCSFWNFDFSNFRVALAKKLIGTETSNLLVKFYSKIALHNWYFQHNCYFILRLVRVTYTCLHIFMTYI